MSRSIDRIVASAFALVGAYVVLESYARLPYRAEYGPGPGFLPMLLGICMFVVSVALFIQTSMGRWNGEEAKRPGIKNLRGVGRVVTGLLLFAASVFLFDTVGFFISYALLVFSLTYLLERYHLSLVTILAVSLLMPIAFVFVFKIVLGVALPVGPLGL